MTFSTHILVGLVSGVLVGLFSASQHVDRAQAEGRNDAVYRHRILGERAVERRPRWSGVRDVPHWVD